ncbi:hypothetical protein ACNFNZ_15305 [Empedobacter brevis]
MKVLEENNYYPFGLKHKGYNNTNVANPNYKYKYNDYGEKSLNKLLTNIPHEVLSYKMN